METILHEAARHSTASIWSRAANRVRRIDLFGFQKPRLKVEHASGHDENASDSVAPAAERQFCMGPARTKDWTMCASRMAGWVWAWASGTQPSWAG